MSLQLEIKQNNNWVIIGDLTVDHIADFCKKNNKLRPKESWTIDCQRIDKIDSAGLAYFIDCCSYAKKLNIKLSFANMPKEALSLMNAQGVSRLFD